MANPPKKKWNLVDGLVELGRRALLHGPEAAAASMAEEIRKDAVEGLEAEDRKRAGIVDTTAEPLTDAETTEVLRSAKANQ